MLPGYMVPSAVVVLDALPLTANGKLDRAALPEVVAATAPAPVSGTARETELAAIWADVLGVAAVGLHDDFFAIGGHSLLAVRVMAEVERRFGRALPVATIFQRGATVAGLAWSPCSWVIRIRSAFGSEAQSYVPDGSM